MSDLLQPPEPTPEFLDEVGDLIIDVRDSYPRRFDDVPSSQIVDALAVAGYLRALVTAEQARAEAEKRYGVPSRTDTPRAEWHAREVRAFEIGALWASRSFRSRRGTSDGA